MKRLAIITTHPIQYNAPLFALLASRGKIALKVFYTWGNKVLENKFDPGFGKAVKWDIPLLEGYDVSFVENISKDPGSHHFKGIDNPTLIKEIEYWKADAVLVYGWSFKSHLKALRHFSGRIPVYFRGDSTILQQIGLLKTIGRKLLLKWIYKHVDIAFYVGTNNKAYYKKFGLKEMQLVFGPHAVDNYRFSTISKTQELWISELKRSTSLDQYNTVFVYAGKLEEKKNVSMLLETFSKINNKSVGLVIVGNGALEELYKDNYKTCENIHFMDFQNQSVMPLVYRLGDVLVLPSKGPSETWGLVVNEAMATGRAILVSSDCGAAVDLVQDGVNGYVFRSDCQDSLLEKLNLLIQQHDHFAAMGNASRRIVSNWSFEHICEAIEGVVSKIPNHR